MLKKAIWPPLPNGRGSASACKNVAAVLSRARKQAVFGLIQHFANGPRKPLRATLPKPWFPCCRRERRLHILRARRRSRSDRTDRKSTRLNSSHLGISYAVFC